ncbi:type VI secretion system baseplate subunit TssF [Sphingomonas sp. PL-96]|uniref:type VI secretion system baseplate subunit TssF n=1 Tax=Sphingomonas sp. PL-96 TaxID=2887201 RepID=UPI001E4D8013|nr:type VI secretion system baseplate subunit TssF [Sphingomonas sp. PL-96]MCC2975688.1 type VI secretion system baseplate subunit TssF [Sphingomonas sp. PL-96]
MSTGLDPRLLRFYNDELAYLREEARAFGEEHEAVAGRLGLKTPTDPDPYVERLLEGVAFLGARVQLKIADQYPEFTQHLLHAIQPHYLAPTPSMCVVGFEPKDGDPVLIKGHPVPRNTPLVAVAAEQGGVPVEFRTGHDVTLWPLRITQAEYLPSRAAIAPFAAAADVRAEAGLRLRFEATAGVPLPQVLPKHLPIYLSGSEAVPAELYRQIIGDTQAVIARSAEAAAGPEGWLRLPGPGQLGFADDEALLPAELRSFRGYRLLSEYFACPERFLFVDLQGLDRAFRASESACDVVLLFSRSAPALHNAIEPANFRLFATPAINLFEKQLGRVRVSRFEHEHHVVPDRARPLDFEVFRLLGVQAFAANTVEGRTVAPLYAPGALLHEGKDALFYSTQLRPRRLSTREQRLRRRGEYTGTESWISLTAPGDPSRLDGIDELAVRALVTNRELPELLTFRGNQHFTVSGVPARAVTVLRAPTRPKPPMGLGDAAWRVIGHLTPNYTTLAPEDGSDPSVLRDHLALYGRQDDAASRRQVDGVLAIQSERIARRVPGMSRMAIARGHRIRVALDDAAFDKGRMFLFSAVLERFLAEFASINSFTETHFRSANEGELRRWPLRIGRRPTI